MDSPFSYAESPPQNCFEIRSSWFSYPTHIARMKCRLVYAERQAKGPFWERFFSGYEGMSKAGWTKIWKCALDMTNTSPFQTFTAFVQWDLMKFQFNYASYCDGFPRYEVRRARGRERSVYPSYSVESLLPFYTYRSVLLYVFHFHAIFASTYSATHAYH